LARARIAYAQIPSTTSRLIRCSRSRLEETTWSSTDDVGTRDKEIYRVIRQNRRYGREPTAVALLLSSLIKPKCLKRYLCKLKFASLIVDAAFHFLLVWYYCTLTIRERILIANGSRIKGWWNIYHFISTACLYIGTLSFELGLVVEHNAIIVFLCINVRDIRLSFLVPVHLASVTLGRSN
uniref:Ion_trans domain-containing protein n=1 Tax=Echinostoma caproni TaxID=27848 RepID=A0A183B3X7_9TREM